MLEARTVGRPDVHGSVTLSAKIAAPLANADSMSVISWLNLFSVVPESVTEKNDCGALCHDVSYCR